MALNENLHIIAGTLGQDPELRFGSTGTPVCSVSVASKYWDSQKKEEVTEWLRCVIIGKQAQYVADYAKKGSEIMLKGRVHTNKWQNKEGQNCTTTETVCFEASLPRVLKDVLSSEGYEGGYQPQQQQPSPTQSGYERTHGKPARQTPQWDGSSDPDEDAPF